jgi:hypothetical protein
VIKRKTFFMVFGEGSLSWDGTSDISGIPERLQGGGGRYIFE